MLWMFFQNIQKILSFQLPHIICCKKPAFFKGGFFTFFLHCKDGKGYRITMQNKKGELPPFFLFYSSVFQLYILRSSLPTFSSMCSFSSLLQALKCGRPALFSLIHLVAKVPS